MGRNSFSFLSKLIPLTCIMIAFQMLPADPSTDQGRVFAVGKASWYSRESPGIRETTANMEIFDDTDLTCAIWDIPFNTRLEVTNLDNGRSIVVRVNDRGPARRYCSQGRVIDLSKEAFSRIADTGKGLISVSVRPVRDNA